MRTTVMGLIVIVGLATGCAPIGEISADAKQMAASSTAFGLDLYAKLAAEESNAGKNLFLSPCSVHTTAAMAAAGARGVTADQMRRALAYPQTAASADGTWSPRRVHAAYRELLARLRPGWFPGYTLHVANALWGQGGHPWRPEFIETIEDDFNAEVHNVDFRGDPQAAGRTIGAWVRKQTKGAIPEMLAPEAIGDETRLVLTNAAYFKGDWAEKFDPEATTDAPFTLADGKTVPTPLMHQSGEFGYAEDEAVQILSMPYKGKDLAMVVVLPKAADGLASVEKSMSPQKLAGWLGKLEQQEVDVFLPRFKIACEFRLRNALTKMGMIDAFDPNAADLSGMTGRKGLFISAAVHKAFVKVDEEGTEAVAVTWFVAALWKGDTPVFRADRPFLFLIRHHKTGAVLFLGRLMDPTDATAGASDPVGGAHGTRDETR